MAGRDYRFLGQNIHIGSFIGLTSSAQVAVLDQAVSFSVLQYFLDNVEGGLSNPNGASAIFKQGTTNTFALCYRYTTTYGWSTWVKWANTYRGITISDDDIVPVDAPYNNWGLVGQYADYENLTISEILDNSFAFYQIESGLLPYWYAPTNEDMDLNTLTYGGNTNIFLVTSMSPDFTKQSPIMPHGSGNTNWIDANTTTDPAYQFGGYETTFPKSYNPLNISDSVIINDFKDDTATTGGGYGGDYGYSGSPWGIDYPLGLDILDTGLVSMYSPTKAQCRDLATFLWSDSFINAIKKAWSEPMDAIISFGIVPIDLSSFCYTSASNVYIGNVNTNCQMYELKKAQLDHDDLDMGTVNVNLNFSNCFDWEPFCTATLYLPFIGFVPIKINDIMGGSVHVAYQVDLFSGDCIASVEVSRKNGLRGEKWGTETHVAYQYRGNCMIQIPLSCRDYSSMYKSLVLSGIPAMGSALSGDIGTSVKGGVQGAVSALMEGPDIQRSGNYSGSIAGLSNRQPCLIITRTMQHLPDGYWSFEGWPCFMPYVLGTLHGFTMVDKVIDNTVEATDTEKMMIEEALMKGVIL